MRLFGQYDFAKPFESLAAVNEALNNATKNRASDLELIEQKYKRLSVESMKEGQAAVDASRAVLDETKKRELQLKALEDQYKVLGIESAASLQNSAEDIREAFQKIKDSGQETASTLDKAFLKVAEAEIKAAEAAGKPIPPLLEQEAVSRGLSAEYNKLVESLTSLKKGFEAIETRTQQITKSTESLERDAKVLADWLEQNKDVHRSFKVEIDDLKDLKGSWDNVEKAQNRAMLTKRDDFKLSQDVLNQLSKENYAYDSLRKFIDEYTKAIQAENEVANQNLKTRIAQNEALANEHQQRSNMFAQQGDYRQAAEEEAKAVEAGTQAANERYQVEQNTLESLRAKSLETLNNAMADGQLTEAEGALINQSEAAVEAQKEITEATRETTNATIDGLEQQRNYNTVMDDFSDLPAKAARRNERVTREFEDRLRQIAVETAKQGSIITNFLTGWENRLEGWSEAAKNAFLAVRTGTKATVTDFDELSSAMKRNQDDFKTAFSNLDFGYVKWANTVALQAIKIEAAFLSQAKAALTMSERLDKVAASSNLSTLQLENLIKQSETTAESLNLLDGERLDNLKASIESVKERMEELKQETKDAKNELEEMNAELAAERGDDYRAQQLEEQLDYQQRLAEIKEKLDEADTQHNQELIQLYTKQKQVLEQIHFQRTKNIELEKQQKDEEAKKESSSSSSSISSSPVKSVHVLQFQNASGTSRATATVSDEATAQRVIEIIKQAGGSLAG